MAGLPAFPLELEKQDPSLLQKELQARKERLARAKTELQAQFAVYASELDCVAVLERAVQKAINLH